MRAFARFAPLFALAGVLVACDTEPKASLPTVDRQAVSTLASATLTSLQSPSFKENREYCGVIGIDPSGTLRAAKATRGRAKLCITLNIPDNWTIVGHYHTHGAYSDRALSEVPSVQDMESIKSMGVHGYVSTPGGRLWYYDGDQAYQMCGVGCLPKDPRYKADRPVAESYTRQQLQARQDAAF